MQYIRADRLRVVLDTNVVAGHILAEDGSCTEVLRHLKDAGHKVVVCEKLLREYRGVIAQGNRQLYSIVDVFLFQRLLSLHQVEKRENPVIRICFGPEEDRFHLQLAIDAKAKYHVTKDRGVLDTRDDMRAYGVHVVRPKAYLGRCP